MGDDYQTLLTSYCMERFLYRLGVSDLRTSVPRKGTWPPGGPWRWSRMKMAV